MRKNLILLLVIFGAISCSNGTKEVQNVGSPYISYPEPNHYYCKRIDEIRVDGDLSDWDGIEWTEYFNDIEGSEKPKPKYTTRAKIAWDDDCLYIAAEIQDPHVWANLTQRDTVIFYDNDFEVFIDPDGDTHHYYEFEMNALATVWDLMLTMPYRDFGHVIDSWDIAGLQVSVKVLGTINDPTDEDQGWNIELAMPFSVLQECSSKDGIPAVNDYWRINFSRVEWKTEVKDSKYVKQINPDTGKPFPEDNWVWSPQYHINMHMPEYWGYLIFSDSKTGSLADWTVPQQEYIKWHLRNIYYLQNQYRQVNGTYAFTITALDLAATGDQVPAPEIFKTFSGYQAVLPDRSDNLYWMIDEKGWIRKLKKLDD